MRLVTILNTARKKVYQLWNKDKHVLSLTYNAAAGTARIESFDEKRLFLISKEGFLKNKTVVRNEYGFRVGWLGQENGENFIELDGERFFYITRNAPSTELVLYKQSPDQPLIICKLSPAETADGNINFETGKPVQTPGGASLLMTLCWFMFQPFAKTKALELTA